MITGLQTIVLFVSDAERNAGILDPDARPVHLTQSLADSWIAGAAQHITSEPKA